MQEFTHENQIVHMDWPAQNMDLNIIENVWLKLKSNLQNQVQHLTSVDLLMTAKKNHRKKINHYIRFPGG